MGRFDVQRDAGADRLRSFTQAVLHDLLALERMIDQGMVENGRLRLGAEQEVFLVDGGWRPATRAMSILEELGWGDFTTELVTFQVEFNGSPLELDGRCFSELEAQVVGHLARLREVAARHDTRVVLTGILPTLGVSDLALENMAPQERYHALNDAILRMCGGSYTLTIDGIEELALECDSVMLEGCNSSFQVHLQVSPDDFARVYNAAQLVAGPVLAAAAASPLLFGRRLWAETRVPLFRQSISVRSPGRHLRQVAPRVHFGQDWIESSVLELYREDVARLPALLAIEVAENSLEVLRDGGIPELGALQMYNSTVYRWNRPCYGILDGSPNLRIECRFLPSGPSVLDEVANAALWIGAVLGAARRFDDLAQRISFAEVESNFGVAARRGLRAGLHWVDGRTHPAAELLRDQLLPLAREGLQESGVEGADVERYLSIVDQRIERRQTGARWIERSFVELSRELPRSESLAALTAALHDRQQEGLPCHEWELARVEENVDWSTHYQRVEQIMTTDLFTVSADELVDLAALIMDWKRVRTLPVEDGERRLLGVVSYTSLLRTLAARCAAGEDAAVPVSEIMDTEPLTVSPQTSTLEAMQLMRRHRKVSVPVVEREQLVGIVSVTDLLPIAERLLAERQSTREEVEEGDEPTSRH